MHPHLHNPHTNKMSRQENVFTIQKYSHAAYNSYHDISKSVLKHSIPFKPFTIHILVAPKCILWQTVKTKIKCDITRYFINVYTVC